jgi:hypothetical protein
MNAPTVPDAEQVRLLRRGFVLEYATLGWNVAGVVILAVAAIAARSVALAGSAWTPSSRSAPRRWWCGNCQAPARPASAAHCS